MTNHCKRTLLFLFGLLALCHPVESDAGPSLSPSPSPFPAPVIPPAPAPIVPPTPAPVIPPTLAPIAPPTLAPVVPPTSSPISVCNVELNTQCVIAGASSSAGQSCDTATFATPEICQGRPTAALMAFIGGGCEQSYNNQELKFSCEDLNGGPPVNIGDEAYIVVTDIKGNGITYFEGLVGVGDNYRLNDNDERFEADLFISIYTPDQSTLLQMVQFHASCSQNLGLSDIFGASQFIEFSNDVQGTVSVLAAFYFKLEISTSQPIYLSSGSVETNFAGIIDLSDQVQGLVLGPDSEPLIVTLERNFIFLEPKNYALTFNIDGIMANREICNAVAVLSFLTGGETPAPVPTPIPTPTVTVPTPTAPVPATPVPTTFPSAAQVPETPGPAGSPTESSSVPPITVAPSSSDSTSSPSPEPFSNECKDRVRLPPFLTALVCAIINFLNFFFGTDF